MRLRLHRLAVAEIAELEDEIDAVLTLIDRFPEAAPQWKERADRRIAVLDRFPFTLPYQIHVPPLRERRGDLGPLVAALTRELAQKLEPPVPSISRAILARLDGHDWPGNVRELMNTLETAMILGRDALELPEEFHDGPGAVTS